MEKKIYIHTKGLQDEIKIAKNFGWTGWRIPIYAKEFDSIEELEEALTIKEEIELSLSFGDWLSNNSWQPGALELAGIETWSTEEDEDDDEWMINEIAESIYERIKGFLLDKLQDIKIEFD